MKKINWDELYRRNAPKLIGLCRRYTGDEALARDLVHDTFTTAIEKIADFKGKGSLEGWIRKIAVNKALMFLRSQKVYLSPLDFVDQFEKNEAEMETPSRIVRRAIEEASFTSNELLNVIDELPLHHKAVFNLYVVDGYQHQQIAEMLGISPGTSKSHLARARKKVQQLLFEKALEKGPAEKMRKTRVFFLLLLPNRIDAIFRQGFRGFEIPAESVSFPDIPLSKTIIPQGLSIAAKLIISAVGISSVGAGIFFSQLHLSGSKSVNNAHPVVVADSLPAQDEALTTSYVIDSLPGSTPENVLDTATPLVVIKKQIVIHDTICLEKPH